jgi:GNAT superfamily N-acetyltransferase
MSLIDMPPSVAMPRAEPCIRRRARVTFCPGERGDVLGMVRRLFGRTPQPAELAGLAGAPGDAELEVGVYRGGLYLEFSDPPRHHYHGVFQVSRCPGGPILRIDALHIRQPALRGRGLGLRMFARQVATAVRLGVTRIETEAGRRDDENGYYTWPRYGFHGPLPACVRERLPADLAGAIDVLDLMQSDSGRRWWREHGLTLPVVFDTHPQGRCRESFRRYLASRQAGPLVETEPRP